MLYTGPRDQTSTTSVKTLKLSSALLSEVETPRQYFVLSVVLVPSSISWPLLLKASRIRRVFQTGRLLRRPDPVLTRTRRQPLNPVEELKDGISEVGRHSRDDPDSGGLGSRQERPRSSYRLSS